MARGLKTSDSIVHARVKNSDSSHSGASLKSLESTIPDRIAQSHRAPTTRGEKETVAKKESCPADRFALIDFPSRLRITGNLKIRPAMDDFRPLSRPMIFLERSNIEHPTGHLNRSGRAVSDP
jgi:hypothetical protein